MFLEFANRNLPWEKMKSAMVGHKEYIITHKFDGQIKIWHLVKGKMKLLRAIILKRYIFGLAYLEDQKIIAIVCKNKSYFVKFLSLITGKLVSMLDLGMKDAQNLVVMTDKNALGVVNKNEGLMKIVKWGSP